MANYVDYFDSKNRKEIKKIYNNAFPKNEQIPFWILKLSSKSNNTIFKEIIIDNRTAGILFLIFDNDIAYLMYFAINKEMRNKGLGSSILKDLIKKYNAIILSIETKKNIVSKKRKDFYLRNNFYETNKYTKQNGVYYELLCSNKNYVLTKDKLINIYKKMTNSKLLSYLINKKFELFDVNFIDKSNKI